ncbi:MAG: EAL domain-containing response regulator [Hahellaceae bacterium]|nr:EAL domain-containing response regulator [Hahellaceae bacterium]
MTKSKRDISYLNILVVDDDAFMRDLVKMTLALFKPGLITLAPSGKEAIEILKQGDDNYHIIMLDLLMPDMDGIETLRHLSKLEYQGGLILFSGADSSVLRAAVNVARGRFLNVLGSIAKPVKAAALSHILEEYDFFLTRQPDTTQISTLSETEFSEGLSQGALTLYYQPQIDIKSGMVVGLEALARWKTTRHAILGPSAFMPLAESPAFIHQFAEQTLLLALDDISRWGKQARLLDVAVNISAAALDLIDLPEKIAYQCQAYGIESERLSIELTETMLDRDLVNSLEVLTRLRMRSIGLSLDDFGTGYSSLERLKSIPFDELKIDGSFVRGANTDPAACAIFESSVSLGKQLNLTIVAEGVETRDDWLRAAEFGCDIVQGYFAARPMPADQLDAWLNQWKGLSSLDL